MEKSISLPPSFDLVPGFVIYSCSLVTAPHGPPLNPIPEFHLDGSVVVEMKGMREGGREEEEGADERWSGTVQVQRR